MNVSRTQAVSKSKNVPYYYQRHRFGLTDAFLCLTGYLRSVLFGKCLEIDTLGLCAGDEESKSSAGAGFGDWGIQADFLAATGVWVWSLELTAVLGHNSGSCPWALRLVLQLVSVSVYLTGWLYFWLRHTDNSTWRCWRTRCQLWRPHWNSSLRGSTSSKPS